MIRYFGQCFNGNLYRVLTVFSIGKHTLWALFTSPFLISKQLVSEAVDEEAIFLAYNKMKRIEENAVRLTRTAKLNRSRGRGVDSDRIVKQVTKNSFVSDTFSVEFEGIDISSIKPFDEIDHGSSK
ncbi:MAG: hypothetical protein JWQ66_1690 [Mucilaginibacter sp.]|nr:hypothetical protein [Mucilaginibacter sp.]